MSTAAKNPAPSPTAKPLSVTQLQQRRSQLEQELKAIEKQIYELEEAYIGTVLPCLDARADGLRAFAGASC